jgi:DNA repair photolyase
VREVFLDWLHRQRPNHAAKVESFIRSTRGGQLSSSKWGERQRGRGIIAEQIEQTFRVFAKRCELDREWPPLHGDAFQPPKPTSGQLSLF